MAGLRASGLTHKEIADRTGIPRRSVTNILGRTPVAKVVKSATVEQVSRALWEVVAAGTAEALRRIADPKTKAGELAQIIRVAAEQHALLNGGVTSRTEAIETPTVQMTWEQKSALMAWLDDMEGKTDDELREMLIDGGAVQIRDLTHRAANLGPLLEAGLEP